MHNLIAIFQTNLIAMILMAIIMYSILRNTTLRFLSDKLFFSLTIAIFVVSAFEITGFVFDLQTYPGAKALNKSFNAILFMINPIPAYLWALYAHYSIFSDKKKLIKLAKIIIFPLLAIIGLSFANLFTDVFFSISENNEYQRGDYFFLATALNIFYLIYATILILSQRNAIPKTLWVPMIGYMIIPIIGFSLQVIFYGQSLMWISIALSTIIVYNNVQNNYANRDWLTRIYNRKHFDTQLALKFKQRKSKKIAGLMMDLNGFKQINDTYGHLEGDEALQKTAEILTETLGTKKYLARYAGDEFVSFFEIESTSDILAVIYEIKKELKKHNDTSAKEYLLSLSIGYAILEDNQTIQEFLKAMDHNMYVEKESIK